MDRAGSAFWYAIIFAIVVIALVGGFGYVHLLDYLIHNVEGW